MCLVFVLRYIARTMTTSSSTDGSAMIRTFAIIPRTRPTADQYPAKFSPLTSNEKYLPAASVKPAKSDGNRTSHCMTEEYSVTVGLKVYSTPNSSQK